jgi:hypothetical protein
VSSKVLTNYEHGIHARNAVWASFFALGITGMAWIPRIPEIKSALGLSDGHFGLLLLASTFGAVPGAQLSGLALIPNHDLRARIIAWSERNA